MTPLTVGSLFSGIGGLDLGLERAGMEVRWQCEIDSFLRRVLAKHWPNVTCYKDVREIDEEAPTVDLICGGFPCQPVSTAGRRKGEKDSRWLWPEFNRVIREVRPRWVLVENVPGLLSIDAGRLFGGVLGDLAEGGYDTEWDCIPAAALGAPHIRDRVFIVAYTKLYGYRSNRGIPQRGGHTEEADVLCESALADATGSRRGKWRRQEGRALRNEARRSQPERRGSEVPNAECDALRQQPVGVFGGSSAVQPSPDGQGREVADASGTGLAFGQQQTDGRRALWNEGPAPTASGGWSTQCRLGIASHGLPGGLDCGGWECGVPRTVKGQKARVARLRGLGNAVVPQVAEYIGRAIVAANA